MPLLELVNRLAERAVPDAAAYSSHGIVWLVIARFSFGYFVGFYLYTMVLGYLWINCFSDFLGTL